MGKCKISKSTGRGPSDAHAIAWFQHMKKNAPQK